MSPLQRSSLVLMIRYVFLKSAGMVADVMSIAVVAFLFTAVCKYRVLATGKFHVPTGQQDALAKELEVVNAEGILLENFNYVVYRFAGRVRVAIGIVVKYIRVRRSTLRHSHSISVQLLWRSSSISSDSDFRIAKSSWMGQGREPS